MPPTVPWIVGFPGAEVAVVALAFALGAAAGSFINVLVHRLPRGESPIGGRSHCPHCGSAIRARDNLPVLGWLLLCGRCRDCGGAISPRYPLVEAMCGTLTAAVAAAEIGGGGRWLPLLADGSHRGIDRLLLLGEWSLLGSCVLHASILLTIVAWSMVAGETGKHACPGAAVALAGVMAVVLAMPPAGPIGLLPAGGSWPPSPPRLATLMASLAGAALGAVAGRLTRGAADGCCLALVGAALGWQAVTVVTIMTLVIRATNRMLSAAFGPVSSGGTGPTAGISAIVAAAAAQIVGWGPILAAWRHAMRLLAGS